MRFGRWLLLAVLASFAAMLVVSSAFGRGQSAVIFDYEVTNDGGILFADEYDRLGGVDTLGYPASYRFEQGGFTYQVTQRALLQWRADIGVAYLGNIFEMLEHAGLDQWLLESKGIPLPIKDDGSNGDWEKAKATRLSWLTNEQIKAKFLANPNPDAISDWNEDSSINLYGLPMSMPEKHGPFISQRFQRVAFQLWVDEVPGSPAPGTVIGVLAGDLLKEAGLVPSEGLHVDERPVVVVAPAPAPAPSQPAPRATSRPQATAKPQPTAEATPEATPDPDATPIAADLSLSALGLSGVTLSPAFDAETGTYTASVANDVESTTVTATATNGDAAVAIKLNGTVDDDGTVELVEGDGNVITIEVTVGEDTATYTVTVTRAAALPEGAVLSTLTVSDVTLKPGFAPEITGYTASVVHGVGGDDARITIKATVPTGARLGIDPLDTVTDVADDAATQGHQVDLEVGANTITLAVTAGDVTTFYEIVITRGEAAADATLETLSLDAGTLDPAFSRHTNSYRTTVANSVADVTVTAEGNDTSGAEPTIVYRVGEGAGTEWPNNQDITLLDGSTTRIRVEVTSNDGKNKETYTIRVTRLASIGDKDTTLQSLSVKVGEKELVTFSSSQRSYTASVDYGDVTELPAAVTWTVNAANADAVLIVNNGSPSGPGATGDQTIPDLAVGDTFIKVRVTSPDDSETVDYDITVTRRSHVASDDTSLSAISATQLAGVIDPVIGEDDEFDTKVRAYTATVANSLSSIEVSATAKDTDTDGETGPDGAAMVEVRLGEDKASPFTLTIGPNVIAIEVTAEDGTTTKLYTITVTRQASAGAGDASLSRLTINDTTTSPATAIELTPSFSRLRATYTAEVSFDTTQLTAGDFTPNRPGTTIVTLIDSDNDGDINDETTNVALATVGDHKFIVRASTNESPASTMDYSFTVTRLADVPNTVATLSGITIAADPVTVTLAPSFNKDTLVYIATVPFLDTNGDPVDEVSVSGTVTADSGATTVVKLGDDMASPFELKSGPNVITIEVTAEDKTTKLTYTITLTRTPQSTDSTLSALSVKDGETELVSSFSADRTSYTATVANSVTALVVAATANDAAASLSVSVSGGTPLEANTDGNFDVTLDAAGDYHINVTVTAEDGSTTGYRVSVTKAVS